MWFSVSETLFFFCFLEIIICLFYLNILLLASFLITLVAHQTMENDSLSAAAAAEPIIITSVDPGSTNCGFAKYSVKQDRFLLFDLADLRTPRAGDVVDALHTHTTVTRPDIFSDTTLVVVERQLGMSPRNMCIEASLRTQWRGRCIVAPPQEVMQHFGIPSGTPRPIKKKKMMTLTRELLTPRENAMVERIIEARRAANRLAKKDFKTRLTEAITKKRKRLPKLKMPYARVKYDDILEAAAQAIWAAEDLLGHKVKRRQRQKKKRRRKKKHQSKLQDIWTSSPVGQNSAVIVID